MVLGYGGNLNMDIEKAMSIFGLTNIAELDTEELKKSYKTLMRKYHPDTYKGTDDKAKDIIIAYRMLNELMTKMSELEAIGKGRNEPIVALTLSELITLYDGNSIHIKVGSNIVNFTKSDLRAYNTYIILDMSIYHNGIHTSVQNMEQWNVSDIYSVHHDLRVRNMRDADDVQVGILNTLKRITMDTNSLKIVITEKFNIKINVSLTKVLDIG